jgi:anti-sigma-K factor RskA
MSDARDHLAAEFALGTLEGAERAQAEALFAQDSGFRAVVEVWRARLAPLDDTAEPLTPTPQLWEQIESRLLTAPQGAQARDDRPGFSERLSRLWQSLEFWRPLGLASAFAGLMLTVALVTILQRGPQSPVYVAVLNTDDGKAAAVVNAYADGTVELVPLAPIAVPGDRIIEVWTLQSRDQGPVSIGRIDQARRLKLDLSRLGRPETNHLFELTLEPPGGSPTGKPTGPILMKGLAARSI